MKKIWHSMKPHEKAVWAIWGLVLLALAVLVIVSLDGGVITWRL